MSTIGKIFLVLNLVLAGLFVGWAAKTLGHVEDMKQQHAKALEDANKATQATQLRLDEQLALVLTEKNAKETAENERRNLSTENTRLKEDLDAQRRANSQLSGDVAKINETISGLNDRLQSIEQSKDTAMADARKMQGERDAALRKADEAEMAKRTAEESFKTSELNIAKLEKELKSLRTESDRTKAQLATVVADTGYNLTEASAVPEISAQVIKVDMSSAPGLVALNKGKNDGVARGYVFEIYSGTTYKGQVRVEYVHPDVCSAVILVPPPNGGQIMAGDRASTRL